MKLTKVRVLYSRNRLGHRGDVINVTPDRLKSLLDAGLVEKIEQTKKSDSKSDKQKREGKNGFNKGSDT